VAGEAIAVPDGRGDGQILNPRRALGGFLLVNLIVGFITNPNMVDIKQND
jgi:hypothetical protein